ncbi:MAG: TrmH family RNA methyltransferase, partial [Clostridia bacterium]
FSVNVKYYNSFEEYVSAQIDKREYYSFMLQSSSLLTDASIDSPYSLIFGNEATGLPDYYSTITKPLRIGHSKAIDSLNLQTAVSIALFYATKGDFN